MWQQCNGDLDAIVMFVGSGGALGGLSRGLRAFKPDLRVYVVEPSAASSLATGCCSDAGHAIQGGGYGREKLSLLKDVKIDGHLICSDTDASSAARSLAIQEGVLAGYSTGAQLHGAAELLRGPRARQHHRIFSLRHGNEVPFHRVVSVSNLIYVEVVSGANATLCDSACDTFLPKCDNMRQFKQ